ncbi:MAG: transglycosylase domain-containing protein [Chloroflexi bacterium]|nr:transglycosylase domain-containing protein [Chloroflexota bacterium]
MVEPLFYFDADEPQGGGGGTQPENQAGSSWKRPTSLTGRAPLRNKPVTATTTPNRWQTPPPPKGDSAWAKPPAGQSTYQPAPVTDTTPTAEADSAPVAEETPVDEVLPFDDTGASAPVQAVPVIDDDADDDTFSMSELIALASLAEKTPSTPAEPVIAADATPALDAVNDPAEYARRALAALQAQQESEEAVAPIEVAAAAQDPQATGPTTAQPGLTEDPAEVARRRVAELTGGTSGAVPAAVGGLTAEQQDLANRYHAAEANVRRLREQYRAGQLTREQLQAELRGQMVLDEYQVWWMLGVETDTWYRYENGGWVAAVPAVLAAQSGSPGASIPIDQDLSDRTVPTTPITSEGFIPRQVPMNDPDYTLPGTGAVFMEDPNRTVPRAPYTSEATVPMQTISDATVPTPAVSGGYDAGGGYNYVPTPAVVDPIPAVPPDAVRQAQQQRTNRTITTGVLIAAVLIGLVFLGLAVVIIGGVLYYNSLASPWQDEIAALANYTPQFQTARILAADGSTIAELISRSGVARDRIDLENIAPELIHAVISTENERFYDDPGWDLIAIGRAFLQNVQGGEITSGASTITQQIARNLILQDTTVSADRKLQEIIIAAEIARRYDKNFILELYLNEIFFGNQSYGVESAAQFYFHHSAADLNLPEAAMLAGLIQAPARYDPVINRQAAFERMDTVLNLMAQVGCLQFQHAPYNETPFCVTEQDLRSGQVVLDRARVEAANYTPRTFQVRYPHFVNYIQTIIEQSFGTDEMFRRGFTIRTTLDPRVQDTAQTALSNQIQQNAFTGMNTGAIMVTDPRDGSIRAMIGSPNFSDDSIDGQVNNVFTWQQPGSSIKPILYTGALEGFDQNGGRQYFTPASIIWDVPTRYDNPPYEPRNFDGRFRGPEPVRFALQNSLNIPAVKTLAFLGVDNFRSVAERMGIRFLDEAQFTLASALGANEVRLYDMMQAYGTLANTGMRVPLYSITQITAADGSQIELPARAQPGQVIQPQVAYLMENILSDNNARAEVFGLNSGLAIADYVGLIGAKTGTSNDNRDLWTMGFTRNAVVGVWLGRVDNGPTTSTTQTSAVPVWNTVMRAALEGRRPDAFANPGGVVEQTICADTGTLFDQNIPCTTVRTELFMQNQLPPAAAASFLQTIPIDTWTGYRANQYCPDSVITDTFVSISDPTAVAWLNTPDGQVWAQSLGIELPVQAAPENECTAGMALPQINLTGPVNGATVSGVVNITGTVSAPNFSRYELQVASLNAPDNWSLFSSSTNQVNNGTLGTLDTAQLANGLYRIRLMAYSSANGTITREVQIGVNNLAATALPTVDPAVPILPTVDGGGGVSGGGATPTATIIPFGGLSDVGSGG